PIASQASANAISPQPRRWRFSRCPSRERRSAKYAAQAAGNTVVQLASSCRADSGRSRPNNSSNHDNGSANIAVPTGPGRETSPPAAARSVTASLVAAQVAQRIGMLLPMLAVEGRDRQPAHAAAVEGAHVDVDAVRIRARHVERLDA